MGVKLSEVKFKSNVSNGGAEVIVASEPYIVSVQLEGASDLLFHRWNSEAVEAKSKAAKNSVAKKTDNLESYVYRNDDGDICIPGEYVRQSVIHAARYRQDPRSPRKSAMDLFKAGVGSLTVLASVGKGEWDYEDKCRAVVHGNGITRVRPALKAGWKADFQLIVLLPEYISRDDLYQTLANAGRLIGLADHRPTYGRFNVVNFK